MHLVKVKVGKQKYKNDADESGLPKKVTFEMSLAEATFIAKVIGRQNYNDGEAVFPGGGDLNSEIYYGLTGEFFNKFFFGGVDDAVEQVKE